MNTVISKEDLMMKNEITVVVLSYNPKRESIELTIRSILMQKNIDVKIIVSDDCSKEDYSAWLEELFRSYGFDNYILLKNDKNVGTVNNLYNALKMVDTEYVKDIGQGDFFYSEYALSEWANDISEEKADVCFCDFINYRIENEEYTLIRKLTYPQVEWAYKKGGEEIRKQLLIYDDYCCGAAMLCKTEVMKSYLDMIKNDVVYTEDAIYRIMAYDNVKMSYSDKTYIMYEYGYGVSSSGDQTWKDRMYSDMLAIDNIQITRMNSCPNNPYNKHIKVITNKHKKGANSKFWRKYNRIIKGLKICIRNRFRLRYSKTNKAQLEFSNSLLNLTYKNHTI